MQVQKINNQQNTNFSAIKLPQRLTRSSALTTEIQNFLASNKGINIEPVMEKDAGRSWTAVEYLMTKFDSLQENELLAKLIKHDSRVTAVEDTRVASLKASLFQ